MLKKLQKPLFGSLKQLWMDLSLKDHHSAQVSWPQDKTRPPLDPSSSLRIRRPESASDFPPEKTGPRPGGMILEAKELAPINVVSSNPLWETHPHPLPSPHGSRPALETAPTPLLPSTDQLSSEERILTQRVFACSLRMEASSSDKDSSLTVVVHAASFTARPQRGSKKTMIENCSNFKIAVLILIYANEIYLSSQQSKFKIHCCIVISFLATENRFLEQILNIVCLNDKISTDQTFRQDAFYATISKKSEKYLRSSDDCMQHLVCHSLLLGLGRQVCKVKFESHQVQ